jgi:hypothetical protein
MAQISDDESCPCRSGLTFGECHGKKIKERKPVIIRHVQLQVIPEPDPGSRAVLVNLGGGTVISQSFDGTDSLDCGKCGAPLMVGVTRSHVNGLVLQCSSCGAFNDTELKSPSDPKSSNPK